MDSNDIEIEEVLYRYFRKELSADEVMDVESWVENSPENKRVFDEAQLMFLDMKGISYYKSLDVQDVDQSWEKFKKENNVRSMHQAPTSSISLLRYAASIVAVIGVAIGVYFYQTQVEEVTIASVTEVRELTLPDGSLISLNEGASIEYQEPFQNNERRVTLTGDAYFEVAKIDNQPFVVEIGDVEVRVLGTKFLIDRPDDNSLSVQVDEGSVLMSYNDLHQIVETGQTLSLDMEEEQLVEIEDEIGLTSFWKTRRLVFNVTSIEDVVNIVNQAYETSIVLEGSTEGCSLTVTFDNESFDNVLEIISSTLNYELIEDGASYTLKGNGCQ